MSNKQSMFSNVTTLLLTGALMVMVLMPTTFAYAKDLSDDMNDGVSMWGDEGMDSFYGDGGSNGYWEDEGADPFYGDGGSDGFWEDEGSDSSWGDEGSNGYWEDEGMDDGYWEDEGTDGYWEDEGADGYWEDEGLDGYWEDEGLDGYWEDEGLDGYWEDEGSNGYWEDEGPIYNNNYGSTGYRSTPLGTSKGYSSYSSWKPVSFGSTPTYKPVSFGGTSVHYVTQPSKPAKTTVTYVPTGHSTVVYKPTPTYYTPPTYHYPQPVAAPTCKMYATKTGNNSYTLTWNSYGSATSAMITNLGTVAVSGSRTVNASNLTYVMTVYGQGGSDTCSVHVDGGTPNVSVTLSQVPYTGMDLGPIGNMIYFLTLSAASVTAAYMLFFYRGGVFNGFAFAGVSRRSNAKAEAATIVNEYTLPGYGTNVDATVASTQTTGVTHDSMKMVSDGTSTPRIVINRS